jgi:hypothetical protein
VGGAEGRLDTVALRRLSLLSVQLRYNRGDECLSCLA